MQSRVVDRHSNARSQLIVFKASFNLIPRKWESHIALVTMSMYTPQSYPAIEIHPQLTGLINYLD